MRHLLQSLPLLLLILLLIMVSTATACLWDTDTLHEEMSESPSAIELVTGAFARHSDEFYRWRIENRKALLEQGDDQPLHYDDIAVAYDKLHQQEKAIDWMTRKQEKYPGKYETFANLGTFHIHNGNFPEGIRFLEKALQINPEAHFNRERYQLYVVQYLQHRSEHGQIVDGKLLLPLSRDPFEKQRKFNNSNRNEEGAELHDIPERGISSFYSFIADDLADKTVEKYNPENARMSEQQTAAAVQGILGMMRFGHHDSPVLLECLADLLVPRPLHGVGNRIAARALLRASYEVQDETARQLYRQLASRAVSEQEGIELAQLEKAFQRELSQAQHYFQELVRLESAWIANGDDVDSKFREHYYQPRQDETSLTFFPVEFEQEGSRSRRHRNLLPYSIFVTAASLVLSISIAVHLLPSIIRKYKDRTASAD